MATKLKRSTFSGALIMLSLLIGAVIVAGMPIIIGIIVVALMPNIGRLAHSATWVFAHVLWIYPVIWLVTLITDSVVKHLTGGRKLGPVGAVVDGAFVWLVIALLYSLIFTEPLGAAMAALITVLLFRPCLDWLEKHTPTTARDDG